MSIYDYMVARAKSEGKRHSLLKEQYEQWFLQGIRSFFGVLVDDFGRLIRDDQNPTFFLLDSNPKSPSQP